MCKPLKLNISKTWNLNEYASVIHVDCIVFLINETVIISTEENSSWDDILSDSFNKVISAEWFLQAENVLSYEREYEEIREEGSWIFFSMFFNDYSSSAITRCVPTIISWNIFFMKSAHFFLPFRSIEKLFVYAA